MSSKRILITGLSTYWGGRLAQVLEQDPEIETVIGIDRRPPKVALERTEFVQVTDSHSLIRRIVDAAEIDTVVDTRLVVDSSVTSRRRAHENNVIGTMNVLAACGGESSPVRKVVFKSSAHFYGCEQDDPAFFTEEMRRPHPPRTPLERDIVEAERSVADFASRNGAITVTVLRFTNGLGPDLRTAHMDLLGGPVLLGILGFDPRYQFVHEDDIAACLEHAVRNDLDGIYNCAADGVLALSEVADLLGKRFAPVLPPVATGLFADQVVKRLGLDVVPEMRNQLRYGRALDNRKFKATGFRYRYTTRETVLDLRKHQRLAPIVGRTNEPYRYEAAVEEFLRFSPSVRTANAGPAASLDAGRIAELQRVLRQLEQGGTAVNRAPGAPASTPADFDGLAADEVVALLPSVPAEHLSALREHEAANAGREPVLQAIDRLLARH